MLAKVARATAAAPFLLAPLLFALGAFAALRYVGERWWVTGLALYLPRIVWAAPVAIVVVLLVVTRRFPLLWTQLPACLVFLFVLLGFVPPSLRRPAGTSPAMRILSYNVNSARGGVDKIVEEIDRYSPDVVALQETPRSVALTSALESRYATVSRWDQFVLASRFPVLSTEEPDDVEYEGRMRSPRFVRQVLETPLGRVALYAFHPVSPRPVFDALRGGGLRREIVSGRLWSHASAAKARTNIGLRALQARAVAEAAGRESMPVVIAGDTNLPGLSLVLHRELSRYQDGFERAGSGFGYTFPTGNFAIDTFSIAPWMRIDRILASEELAFVRFQVGTSLASDHFCVVADVERRGPP